MVESIGVDICKLDRIKNIDLFSKKILTNNEYQEFLSRNTDKHKLEYLAGRFAGKEAYMKAVSNKLSFKDIEILNNKDGKPYLNDSNALISISHEIDYAVSFVCINKK